MSIRFLADADLSKAIVAGTVRREPAMDFLTAGNAGIRHLPDPEVLAFAAKEQRLLVSHDEHTMPRHFRDFRMNGNERPGVLVIPQSVSIGSAIEELLLI
ncbi:MAG TPA: DUF5615 family PIN-like protein [Bryobacteraceae bacterium]